MIWDIFCSVIDNYGDIGVTWRLSRQLANEHQLSVRLWVDDLQAFQRIHHQVDPHLDQQNLQGVEVRRWTTPMPDIEPGVVVIEALACNLPEEFIRRMSQKACKPLWINLEYLSAESWVEGVHGLPSPHPPLEKFFFMPGYNLRTGGVTREAWLGQRCQQFRSSQHLQADFWQRLKLPPNEDGEFRVSMFGYENRALPGLLSALADSPQKTRILVPEGKVLADIANWSGRQALKVGDLVERGQLTLHVLPMLEQDEYDRLLWACDFNFVRGEDSWLRAQFAARPMVWQAYPQDEEAHLLKLEAFLQLYCAAMPTFLAKATRALFLAWNRQEPVQWLWPHWFAQQAALGIHAANWSTKLASQPDFASNLLIFCKKKLESRA